MLLDIKHQFFFPIRRRTIANGLGPRMVMRPLGRSSRTGLWIFASFRLLFDFSNLYNWSLLHERYLPIRHKMGTSSDAQICGSMVFVWEILLSGRELLPVTAWFKLVTIITSKADRCSGLTNYERLVDQTKGIKEQQKIPFELWRSWQKLLRFSAMQSSARRMTRSVLPLPAETSGGGNRGPRLWRCKPSWKWYLRYDNIYIYIIYNIYIPLAVYVLVCHVIRYMIFLGISIYQCQCMSCLQLCLWFQLLFVGTSFKAVRLLLPRPCAKRVRSIGPYRAPLGTLKNVGCMNHHTA